MPRDHAGMEILSEAECYRLIRHHQVHVGRVAAVVDGCPVVLPVNYRYHDGAIVFRTASGTKLDAALRGECLAFQIDELSVPWQEGWSVLVQGKAEEVTDPDDLETLQALPLTVWAEGRKDHYVRVLPARVSGRRIT
jgi:uncharacterized protein